MRSLPNINKLSDHTFVQKVLDDSIPLMRPDSKATDYAIGTKQRYVAEVGYYTGQVLNQLERIDQAGILINSYPHIKAWRARYGRFEYFQYHMEQYSIALSGLFDRLLPLINQIYEIGLDDELVRYKNISKNLKNKGAHDLDVNLKRLRDSMHIVKRSKNNYTHSVRFWEKQLWYIGVYEFAIRNKTIEDPDGYLQDDMMFDAKLYRREKMQSILENEKAVIDMMTGICEILNEEYVARTSA